MKKIHILATMAMLLAGQSPKITAGTPNPPTGQMEKNFTYKDERSIKINYLLFLPQGYAEEPAKRWPLIFFLHGSGERGTNVWKVATHGPPKHIKDHKDFPFIVVSPQCPVGEIWSNEPLLGLLDEVCKVYSVDTSRVYLTGLSMGGYGTWDLGLSYPERFAAIAPICGGGQTISVLLAAGEKSTALKSLGIWAFHGARDPIVPLAESQRMVDVAKRAGVTDVKLKVYPEAQHDSWTQTYKDPEFYQWLLEHRRSEQKSHPNN